MALLRHWKESALAIPPQDRKQQLTPLGRACPDPKILMDGYIISRPIASF
jgi:hypothetical protein